MLALLLVFVGFSNIQFAESIYPPDPPSSTFSTEMRVVAFESAAHPGVFLRMDCQGVKDGCGGTVNGQLGKPAAYERFVILPGGDDPNTFLIGSAHFIGKYLSTFCENSFLWTLLPNHLRCCGKASTYERFQAIDNEDGTISLRSTYFSSLALLEVWDMDKVQNQTHDYGFGKSSCGHYEFHENHKFIVHELSAPKFAKHSNDRAAIHVPDQRHTCLYPTDSWETIATCDNMNGTEPKVCEYAISVGIQTKGAKARQVKKTFLKKMAKSSTTGFKWASVANSVFEKAEVFDETVEAEPATSLVIQQVVGRCGDVEVRLRTTRKLFDSEETNSKIKAE